MSSSGAQRAPLPALQQLDGGLTVPRRSFDRGWMNAKPAQTTLSGNITNVQTTIPVTAVPGGGTVVATFPSGTVKYRLIVDSEQMFVTGGQGTLTWTVVRAQNGTTAAAHTAPANVLGQAVTNICLVGDSTVQGTIGSADEWAQRLARMLGRTIGGTNGLVGRGFRSVFLSGNTFGFGNNLTEWSLGGGAWTVTTPGANTDRAPFGASLEANGAANVLTWTRPANYAIAAVELFFLFPAAAQVISYSLDGGGTWTNVVGSLPVRTITTNIIPTPTNPTTIQVRAANAAGTAVSACILGLTPWFVNPTVGSTQGVMVHNLGKDGDFLSTFCRTNALGDDFAIFDGDQGSLFPDIVVVGPFTNDVAVGSPPYTGYAANLTTLVNRLTPYADVLLMNYCEQNPTGRSSVNQASLRAAVKTVANTLNVGMLDIYDAFSAEGLVGFTACNAAGLMFDDNHASQTGNNDIGARVMRGLGLTTI